MNAHALVPGKRYRVLQDLPDAPTGTILRFERRQHVVYDGYDIHHFTALDDGRSVPLCEIDPRVEQALPRLEEFLEVLGW